MTMDVWSVRKYNSLGLEWTMHNNTASLYKDACVIAALASLESKDAYGIFSPGGHCETIFVNGNRIYED